MEHKGVSENQSDIVDNVYYLIEKGASQDTIIEELKKIKDIEKEDYLYNKDDILDTGSILSSLVFRNDKDNDTTKIISYLVNRNDVRNKYVDSGFIYACRRVDDGAIFAILNSGKVSMSGLNIGIKELKIEARSDKIILKKLAEDIVSKISLKLLQKQDRETRRQELTRAGMKLGVNLPMEIKNYIVKDFLSDDVGGIKRKKTLKKTMTAGSKYKKKRSNKTSKSSKKKSKGKRM
jgi:hypothetical protein